MSYYLTLLFISLADLSLHAQQALARGGGGGSGGGGGGGGGGFGGGSGGSGGGSAPWWVYLIFFAFFTIFVIISGYLKNKQLKARDAKEKSILEAEHVDGEALKLRAKEIFYGFEEAWSKFDLNAMKNLLTENYYKRMVLELGVLQNEHRANPMNEISLGEIFISEVQDTDPLSPGSETVIMRISASAQDVLTDTKENKTLFMDSSPFVEYWHFVKENGVWKLNLIKQETENAAKVESEIAAFAQTNNFYFDPDFGWLMMPNKGVIFSKTNFGSSDINNHVIGYYRSKIVEFYTYIPNPKNSLSTNYLVAQTILPKSYVDILVKKKGLLNLAPWGLKRMYSESTDFNNRFCLFAAAGDQVNSLELLTPNFMEKIYRLPFDLNIEIVGNFLYFYTKARGQATYDNMLQIISWAFDEMKM